MDLSNLLRRGSVASALALLALVPSQVLAAEADQELMSLLRGEVPWAAEAPGAAGARFGLGLDVFFERQESLRITSLEETVRTRDLTSGLTVENPRPGDPGLLNRKFDYRFEMEGAGFELPIALPDLGIPGGLQLYPTLFVQAAMADVTFDFLDRTRSQDSTTFEGRGPLFGTGLDLTTALCRSCPWFTGTSYRFQRLPSVDVERAPPFGPAGFEVLRDESRLSRDVHEASARVGYGFPGNRVVSYLGVRYRSTDLEIEDDLRYLDPFQEVETELTSRVQLESETTLALAGMEAQLGPRIFGQMETSVGDEDWGLLFRVVYLLTREPRREPEDLTDTQAADIAAQIERIRAEYVQAVNALPEIVELAVVDALLDRIEKKLLAILPFPELAAMHDSVRYEFRKVRERLKQGNAVNTTMRSPRLFAPAVLRAGWTRPAEPAAVRLAPESKSRAEISSETDSILNLLDRLWAIFSTSNIEVNLCVTTTPAKGALVVLWPLSYPEGGDRVTSNDTVPLNRGLYAYRTRLSEYEPLKCPFENSDECRLDLLKRDHPLVECSLNKKGAPAGACTVTNEPSGKWYCKTYERK